MSTYDDPNAPDDQIVQMTRADIRKLEQAGQDAASAATLRRENALLKAGIDPTSAQGQVLVNSTVELTDEVLASFKPADPSPEPPVSQDPPEPDPPADPELDPGEDRLTGERAGLSSSAAPNVEEPPPDPYEGAQRAFDEAVANGATEREAGALAFASLTHAAIDGNDKVILKPRHEMSG